jgi:hypothetical protein
MTISESSAHQPILSDSATAAAEGDSLRIEHIRVDGVPASLYYTTDQWGYVSTHLYITIDDVRNLKGFPEGERIHRVMVMKDESFEDTVFEAYAYSFETFTHALRKYDKEIAAAAFKQRLDGFRSSQRKFEQEGLPVARLYELFRKAQRCMLDFEYSWARSKTSHEVESAFKAVQAEIDRLNSTDSFELLLDGLINGTLFHQDVDRNHQIISQVQALSIRSQGFIEPISQLMLRSFYEKQLEHCTSGRDVSNYSLRLRLDDYAPKDILDELELAPEKVTISNGNRSSEYEVQYDVRKVGEEEVPVGLISIPVSVYQKNAAEYGKPSSLPVLPYDIKLMLEVIQQGKVVATGIDGPDLIKKVTKFVKSSARGKKMDDVAKEGYGLHGIYQATPVPPWYKGQRLR